MRNQECRGGCRTNEF